MFKSAFRLFVTIAIIAASGCATSDPYLRIHPGMTGDAVKDLLGDPEDRRFNQNQEEWIYQKRIGFSSERTKAKLIVFESGRVVSLADDEIGNQRSHEIERAKVGATQIRIGGTGARGKSDIVCVSQNAFGAYAEGGGCSSFGCWAPGGSCNTFGCSSAEPCTAISCPHRTDSFACRNPGSYLPFR